MLQSSLPLLATVVFASLAIALPMEDACAEPRTDGVKAEATAPSIGRDFAADAPIPTLRLDRQTRQILPRGASVLLVPPGTRTALFGYVAQKGVPSSPIEVVVSTEGAAPTTIRRKLEFDLGAGRWHDISLEIPPETERIVVRLAGNAPDVVLSRPALIRAQSKPNLILISIDTLRADYLNSWGYETYPTSPFLDRVAASGTAFDNAFAPAPWTIPSHMSVMTGRDPDSLGMNELLYQTPRLAPEVATLAELMRDAGYLTAAFTGSATMTAKHGLSDGFHLYQESYAPAKYVQRDLDVNVHLAQEWLDAHHEHPLFLFFHTFEVHGPYMHSRFALPHFTGYDHTRALYASGIAYTDSGLARFFDHLDTLGLLESSLVVVMSDHGEAFQGLIRAGHGQTLFDEVLRVPLILRGPGIPENHRISTQVPLQDLFATLVDYFGLEAPEGTQSASLLPLLAEAAPQPRPVYLCCMAHHFQRQGWRTPGYKYVFSHKGKEGFEQLFDLERDPGEKHNLLTNPTPETRAVLETMRRNVQRRTSGARSNATRVGVQDDGDEEEYEAQLRALGYIE